MRIYADSLLVSKAGQRPRKTAAEFQKETKALLSKPGRKVDTAALLRKPRHRAHSWSTCSRATAQQVSATKARALVGDCIAGYHGLKLSSEFTGPT